ncbi:cation diffusion facilitator family transporter [Subtercola boreus]|uniref:Cation transporter n=1 Tax=Subtercola boreus TaxID=120213 RepID=A0A3E0W9S0_9MICO|nr:cation diffusion facilitator family transporter [Subtercola boreus]RFA20053.1 cation transporter [Subtercola boreus]RFA20183.1 cation transporter [Subtercola boreus]RFA26509.1 cation transporter [Subtercola boreus]
MIVVIAFIANILVAIAKSVAAVLTGSASLVAEASHSWADAGNEIFLIVADRRSVRQKDDGHPLGFGREAYVWSLLAAVGVFTVGAVVSVMNGVQQLFDPEPASDYLIAYAVLGVSALLEGASLLQSVIQARRTASKYRRRSFDYVLNGSDPTLRAVVAEDSAALAGLAIAFLGILLHQLTGDPFWDSLGSILIGLLLAGVAILLINQNRRYLVGFNPPDRVRRGAAEQLLARPEIARLTYLHLEFVGPSRLFLVAAVDLVGDGPEEQVARVLRRIERQIKQDDHIEQAVLTLSVSDEPSLIV